MSRTNLGTPRSRVEGRGSWEGEREWSGMLVLWLNWALSIPRSITEWLVPATETSGCGPLEVVPCLRDLLTMANFWWSWVWRQVSGRAEKERFQGLGMVMAASPTQRCQVCSPESGLECPCQKRTLSCVLWLTDSVVSLLKLRDCLICLEPPS